MWGTLERFCTRWVLGWGWQGSAFLYSLLIRTCWQRRKKMNINIILFTEFYTPYICSWLMNVCICNHICSVVLYVCKMVKWFFRYCLTWSGDAINIAEPSRTVTRAAELLHCFLWLCCTILWLGCGPEKKNKQLLMKMKWCLLNASTTMVLCSNQLFPICNIVVSYFDVDKT